MKIEYMFEQEDLSPADMNEILNDLKAGKKPKPGPRYVQLVSW